MSDLYIKLIQVFGGSAGVSLTVSGLRWVLAKYDAKIPRAALPLIAYSLGAVAEWLISLTTGTMDPVRAALIMMGAGHLREWVSTLQQHGATGK